MPAFSKVSHISFSARDAEASSRWWSELLGLTELDRVAGDGWRGIVLLHPPTGTVIEFQQHHGNQGEEFDTFKDPDGIQFEMFYRENHP
ncbi:MAG: VOC family protein [Actinobacteria bacterium]|nr:VOC family protein [Actinomycetota bacterium]